MSQADSVVLVDANGNPISSNIQNAETPAQSDTVDLTRPAVALYIGTPGDVKITLSGGSTITMVGLATGVWHPIRVKRLWSTGTVATAILTAY